MYVARVPNRGSPPAILLRESYRDGGKVKNRTPANLSRWPEEKVDALARVLKGTAIEHDAGARLRGRAQPAARARGRGAGHRPPAGGGAAARPPAVR